MFRCPAAGTRIFQPQMARGDGAIRHYSSLGLVSAASAPGTFLRCFETSVCQGDWCVSVCRSGEHAASTGVPAAHQGFEESSAFHLSTSSVTHSLCFCSRAAQVSKTGLQKEGNSCGWWRRLPPPPSLGVSQYRPACAFFCVCLCVCVYASMCVKLDEVASVHSIIQPEDVNTFLVFCKNAYGEDPQLEGLSVVKMHDCVKQSCGICALSVSMNSSVLCK